MRNQDTFRYTSRTTGKDTIDGVKVNNFTSNYCQQVLVLFILNGL